jgi:hypothetical protein
MESTHSTLIIRFLLVVKSILSILNEASMNFNRFTDALGSAENRFYIKPSLQFDVMDESIKTDITVD